VHKIAIFMIKSISVVSGLTGAHIASAQDKVHGLATMNPSGSTMHPISVGSYGENVHLREVPH
jgi:hypothetical protein